MSHLMQMVQNPCAKSSTWRVPWRLCRVLSWALLRDRAAVPGGSSTEVPGESFKKRPWLRALANSPLSWSWPEWKETSPEGRETVVHQSRSCQVNTGWDPNILGLGQHLAMEVPHGGAELWPVPCSSGWDVIPSGLGRMVGAWVQSRFQAALVNKTPHYFRDLLIVFLIRNTGNENTYFSIFADSSAFWHRHPGEAVI